MKLLIVSALLLMSVGCCSDGNVRINISKYKGCVLIDRRINNSECCGFEFRHTFRKGDSVWSEILSESSFAQFQIGDTIK